ncbi:MAG TPA: DUF4131 domain-containing protein, partial [Flavobacteriia bacterium]|nr:DUF4131 domain-containing protein [Flavobacteriia bacterium]
MKFLKFIPAQLTLCVIVGIFIGYQFSINNKVLFGILLILFISLILSYFKSLSRFGNHLYYNVLVYLLFILIGITAVFIQDAAKNENFYGNYVEKENHIYLKLIKQLKPSKYQLKYEAEILNLNRHKSVGKVLLNITKDSINKEVEIGNIYYTKTNFLPIQKPKNPYGFDYANYLKSKQIYHQLKLNDNSLFLIKSENSIHKVSNKIVNRINNNLKKYH